MTLQEMLSRPAAIRLAAFLSRRMPEKVGPRLAHWGASVVCRLQPEVYRIVRTNLAQVLGSAADGEALHHQTCQVFYHFLQGYFDFFRALQLPAQEVLQLVEVPDALQALVRSEEVQARGLLLLLAHTGNFDLAGRVMTIYAPKMQVVSLPNPHGGAHSLNKLRREIGAQVTPLGPAALRQALRTLREGGVVATGGDRPISDLDDPIPFFGRPAHMPSGHVRLALKTGALLVVVGCAYRSQEGRYVVDMEPPLEMIRTGDKDALQINMRRVLDALEKIVRRWSEQWMMFVPVWPELLED